MFVLPLHAISKRVSVHTSVQVRIDDFVQGLGTHTECDSEFTPRHPKKSGITITGAVRTLHVLSTLLVVAAQCCLLAFYFFIFIFIFLTICIPRQYLVQDRSLAFFFEPIVLLEYRPVAQTSRSPAAVQYKHVY